MPSHHHLDPIHRESSTIICRHHHRGSPTDQVSKSANYAACA